MLDKAFNWLSVVTLGLLVFTLLQQWGTLKDQQRVLGKLEIMYDLQSAVAKRERSK